MRTILCFFLSCFSLSLWAQQIKPVMVKAYNAYCIPEVSSPPFVAVGFYRIPDDALVFETEIDDNYGRHKEEGLLLPGKYIARYKNLVGQRMEREVTIGNRDTAIGFCIDSLPYYSQNTLALLKDGESVVLTMSAEPCNGPIEIKIVIVNRDNILTASIQANEDYLGLDNLLDTVTLDATRKVAFIRFENEVSQITESEDLWGAAIYTISSPYFNMRKVIAPSGCWGGGFGTLSDYLFGRMKR